MSQGLYFRGIDPEGHKTIPANGYPLSWTHPDIGYTRKNFTQRLNLLY